MGLLANITIERLIDLDKVYTTQKAAATRQVPHFQEKDFTCHNQEACSKEYFTFF